MHFAQPWHPAAGSDAPEPALPAFVPWVAAAAVALAVGWALGLSPTEWAVLPVALVLLGLVKTGQRWNARRHRRAVADAWLRSGGRAGQFEWRADELTSTRERRVLSRSLRGVVRELGYPGRRSTVPLNRKALRPHASEISALAERLADLERPVSPAGILEVERLLTSPGSPLYLHAAADDLPGKLTTIRRKLEVR